MSKDSVVNRHRAVKTLNPDLADRLSTSRKEKKGEHRRGKLRSGRRPFGVACDSGGAPEVWIHPPPICIGRRACGRNVDAFFSPGMLFFRRRRSVVADVTPVKPGRLRPSGHVRRSCGRGILHSWRQEGKPHANRAVPPCFAVPDTVRFFSKMGSRKLVRLADAKEGKSSERWLEAEDQQGPLSQNRHRRSTLACLLHPTPDEARGG